MSGGVWGPAGLPGVVREVQAVKTVRSAIDKLVAAREDSACCVMGGTIAPQLAVLRDELRAPESGSPAFGLALAILGGAL